MMNLQPRVMISIVLAAERVGGSGVISAFRWFAQDIVASVRRRGFKCI